MLSQPFEFDRLMQPIAADVFFATYWERQHLHVSRDRPGYYDSLLTAADLETLISDSDLRYPAVRLAKGGGYFSPEMYTRDMKHGDESFLGIPDMNRVTEEYRRGATIALPALHRTWKPLGMLCDRLQSQFDHPAHANVYITPGNASGFTPHYDIHEVFVLQIAGHKRWSIYSPVVTLPHRTQLFTPQAYSGQAPMAVVDLAAGDLLYLPRGFLHSTTTSDSFSAHVTIGITVYTWVDLIKEALASAIEDEGLRHALPPGFASRGDLKSALREKFVASLDTLPARTNPDRSIDSFTARVRGAHLSRPPPFRADVTVIAPTSALQMPPHNRYALIQDKERRLLDFNGTRYQLTLPVAATLEAMSRLGTFTPEGLPEDLDINGRLELVRHLLDIQFLTACGNVQSSFA